MLRLPARLVVQIVDPGGRSVRASNILIALSILWNARYYYGNLVGLTDEAGRATLERHELDLRFASDRAMFPMDYKIALDECDPQIEVNLMSRQDLAEARAAIAASSFISSDIRLAYESAQNELYQPSLSRIWADLPNDSVLFVNLTTSEG